MVPILLLWSVFLAVVAGQGMPFHDASVDNLRRTNEFREEQGLTSLVRDSKLESLAMEWSKHMFETKNMYHSDYGMAENVASA